MLATRGGVLDSDFARAVVRFAWHFTSAVGLVVAAALVATAVRPQAIGIVVLLSGGVMFTAAGLIDGLVTRGRHVGWPFLTATGLACLGAYGLA